MQASGLTPLSLRGFFEYVEIVKALLASWLSMDGDLRPFNTTSFDEHLTWWLYYQVSPIQGHDKNRSNQNWHRVEAIHDAAMRSPRPSSFAEKTTKGPNT